MPARGQIPNPSLRRYDHLPVAPAVYVIETGDGVVKVGRARSALARLRELHSFLERTGRSPGRFHVVLVADEGAKETRCLRAMRRVARSTAARGEYFSGISFEDAVRVVEAA